MTSTKDNANTETKKTAEIDTTIFKDGKKNIAVLAWHSISCIKLDMIGTAHIALSQLDIHKDPEGSKAVVECIQSYILDIREYLDDHLEDLKHAFNQLYPLAEYWPNLEAEIFPRGMRKRA